MEKYKLSMGYFWLSGTGVLLLKIILLYFMYTGILPACLFVHHIWIWCPQRPEESIELSGTGIKDVYELQYGLWELNLGSLEETQCSLPQNHLYSPFFYF